MMNFVIAAIIANIIILITLVGIFRQSKNQISLYQRLGAFYPPMYAIMFILFAFIYSEPIDISKILVKGVLGIFVISTLSMILTIFIFAIRDIVHKSFIFIFNLFISTIAIIFINGVLFILLSLL